MSSYCFGFQVHFRLGLFSLSVVLMLIFELMLIGCMVPDAFFLAVTVRRLVWLIFDGIAILEIELDT